jgi:hypothetical protein
MIISGSRGAQVLDLSGQKDVSFFKPEKGRNEIDIIPYEVATNNHPQKLEKGEIDYKLDVWVHRRVGVSEGHYLCMEKTFGKACFICEELKKMIDSGAAGKKEIEAIKAKRRVFYNVIDLNDEDAGIQILEGAHFFYQKEIIEEAEESADGEGEILPFAEIDEGWTVRFRGSEEKYEKNTYIKPKNFTLIEREEQYDDSIIDDAYSLDEMLVIPDYETVKNGFLGIDSDDEDDTEDYEEKEEPKRKKRKRKTAQEPEEPEKEEPKSKKKTRGKKKIDCPNGYDFGVDCDKHKECADEESCDVWEACADEKDRLEGE